MILLSQAERLGLNTHGLWPLAITGGVVFGGVLWRYRQIGPAGLASTQFHWHGLVPRMLKRTLFRAGLVLYFMLIYFKVMKSPGASMVMLLFVCFIENPRMLRSELRLRWLGGLDRVELFGAALRIALREQLLAGLLICAGSWLLVLSGWLGGLWTARVLVAMALSTPLLLIWQLFAIAYMPVQDDNTKSGQRLLVNSLPMLTALPLVLGLSDAADRTQDLQTFSIWAFAICLVLTIISFPIAHRKFQRIEL
jgi:hypothetical protein